MPSMAPKTVTLFIPGAVIALEADAAGRVWRVAKLTTAEAPADAVHVVLDEKAAARLRDALKPAKKDEVR